MMYIIQVWHNDVPGRERGFYIRFWSQRNMGRQFYDVRFALARRLIERLIERGHTVLRK